MKVFTNSDHKSRNNESRRIFSIILMLTSGRRDPPSPEKSFPSEWLSAMCQKTNRSRLAGSQILKTDNIHYPRHVFSLGFTDLSLSWRAPCKKHRRTRTLRRVCRRSWGSRGCPPCSAGWGTGTAPSGSSGPSPGSWWRPWPKVAFVPIQIPEKSDLVIFLGAVQQKSFNVIARTKTNSGNLSNGLFLKISLFLLH